jgi:hypothetical protein
MSLISGIPVLGQIYDWYGSGFDKQKAGFMKATEEARALAARSEKTQREGLAEAQAYWGPANDMYGAVYGDPSRMR